MLTQSEKVIWLQHIKFQWNIAGRFCAPILYVVGSFIPVHLKCSSVILFYLPGGIFIFFLQILMQVCFSHKQKLLVLQKHIDTPTMLCFIACIYLLFYYWNVFVTHDMLQFHMEAIYNKNICYIIIFLVDKHTDRQIYTQYTSISQQLLYSCIAILMVHTLSYIHKCIDFSVTSLCYCNLLIRLCKEKRRRIPQWSECHNSQSPISLQASSEGHRKRKQYCKGTTLWSVNTALQNSFARLILKGVQFYWQQKTFLHFHKET